MEWTTNKTQGDMRAEIRKLQTEIKELKSFADKIKENSLEEHSSRIAAAEDRIIEL